MTLSVIGIIDALTITHQKILEYCQQIKKTWSFNQEYAAL